MRHALAGLGYTLTLRAGDGALGLPDHAPFDRIIATCAVPAIPWAWIDQLTEGGQVLTDIKIAQNAGGSFSCSATPATVPRAGSTPSTRPS